MSRGANYGERPLYCFGGMGGVGSAPGGPAAAVPVLNEPLRTAISINGAVTTAVTGPGPGATQEDHLGILNTTVAGEVRFKGARRVRNIIDDNLETMTLIGTGARAIEADDHITLSGLTASAANGIREIVVPSRNLTNRKYTMRIEVRNSGANIGKQVAIRLQTGDNLTFFDVEPTLTADWQKVTTGLFQNVTTTTTLDLLICGRPNGNNATACELRFVQVEDVSGQSNTNPSEYVSFGVEASPAYHGAYADGVKYFDTANGNTVAAGIITDAAGAAIAESILQGKYAEIGVTNYIDNSVDLSATSWGKTNIAIDSDAVVCPDGTTRTTNTLRALGTNGQILDSITSSGRTISCYARRVTGTGAIFLRAAGAASESSADLSSQLNTSTWTRIRFTTSVAKASHQWGIQLATSGDVIECWGMQVTEVAYNVSQIITDGAPVTTADERVDYTLPAELKVASVGAFSAFCEMYNLLNVDDNENSRALQIYNSSNAHGLILGDTFTDLHRFEFRNGSGNQQDNGSSHSGSAKLGQTWDGAEWTKFENGSALTPVAKGGTTDWANANVHIGVANTASVFLNGCVKNVKLYDARVPDTIAEAITT